MMRRSLMPRLAAVVLVVAACGDAPAPDADAVPDSTAADTSAAPPPIVESGPESFPASRDPNRPAGSLGDPADAYQVAATLSEWKIELSPATVPAGEVTVNLTNTGERAHTIEISSEAQGRWRSAPIAPGGVIGLSMPLLPGSYQVASTTPEYAQRGMKATLVVR